MARLKWKLVWSALALAALLSGCGAEDSLANVGKGLGDLFKGFTIKLPTF